MIKQTDIVVTGVYNDFNGYRKNPQFIMSKPPLPENNNKSDNKKAISIGIGALVTGFAILGLMRMPSGKLTKSLEKLRGYLEKQVEKTKDIKFLNKLTKAYSYVLDKVNRLIQRSESVNNFTSVKDAGFKFVMNKTKFTQKIHQGITKLFTKISRSTVRASWTNTNHKFIKTFETLETLDKKILSKKSGEIIEINGVKKSTKEWLEILKETRNSISSTLKNNTSPERLEKREKIMLNVTENLDKLILEYIKRYKNGKLTKFFVADNFITKYKEKMFADMLQFRKSISLTSSDRKKLAGGFLTKAENLLLSGDTEVRQCIMSLKNALKNNTSEKEIIETLNKLCSIEKTNCGNDKTKTRFFAHAKKYLIQAKEVLQDNKKGKMQEMLEIYKKLAPDEYEFVSKTLGTTVNALDHSISTESIKYFDKLRDLQIGSAPTDILSVVGSGAYIAYALNDTNKDEKISIMLKEGIPVLCAIGTSLFCTARLISGGKAMATGLISGWITNKIGTYVDELREKYTGNKPATTPKAV